MQWLYIDEVEPGRSCGQSLGSSELPLLILGPTFLHRHTVLPHDCILLSSTTLTQNNAIKPGTNRMKALPYLSIESLS